MWDWDEEILGECRSLLSNVILLDHTLDQWSWQPDPVVGYSVRGVYQLLTTNEIHIVGKQQI